MQNFTLQGLGQNIGLDKHNEFLEIMKILLNTADRSGMGFISQVSRNDLSKSQILKLEKLGYGLKIYITVLESIMCYTSVREEVMRRKSATSSEIFYRNASAEVLSILRKSKKLYNSIGKGYNNLTGKNYDYEFKLLASKSLQKKGITLNWIKIYICHNTFPQANIFLSRINKTFGEAISGIQEAGPQIQKAIVQKIFEIPILKRRPRPPKPPAPVPLPPKPVSKKPISQRLRRYWESTYERWLRGTQRRAQWMGWQLSQQRERKRWGRRPLGISPIYTPTLYPVVPILSKRKPPIKPVGVRPRYLPAKTVATPRRKDYQLGIHSELVRTSYKGVRIPRILRNVDLLHEKPGRFFLSIWRRDIGRSLASYSEADMRTLYEYYHGLLSRLRPYSRVYVLVKAIRDDIERFMQQRGATAPQIIWGRPGVERGLPGERFRTEWETQPWARRLPQF